VQPRELIDDPDAPALVMDFAPGRSLATWLTPPTHPSPPAEPSLGRCATWPRSASPGPRRHRRATSGLSGVSSTRC
jgi:hypothetical protein